VAACDCARESQGGASVHGTDRSLNVVSSCRKFFLGWIFPSWATKKEMPFGLQFLTAKATKTGSQKGTPARVAPAPLLCPRTPSKVNPKKPRPLCTSRNSRRKVLGPVAHPKNGDRQANVGWPSQQSKAFWGVFEWRRPDRDTYVDARFSPDFNLRSVFTGVGAPGAGTPPSRRRTLVACSPQWQMVFSVD